MGVPQIVATDAEAATALGDTSKNVLALFNEDYVSPGKAVRVLVGQVADDHPDLVVIEIDTSLAKATAISYGIKKLPTVVLFQKGNESGRVEGMTTQPKIEGLLSQAGIS